MNPTVELVERELNKIFESITEKWVKTSSILKKLNLQIVEQRLSKFNPDGLIKLYLYRRIKGFHNYEKLIKCLEQNTTDAFNLGFSKNNNNKLELPTKRAFNKFLKNKIGDNLKSELDNLAKNVLRTATRKGIVLDLEIVNKAIKEKKDKKRQKRKTLHEATKLVKKLVYPQIDVKIKKNGKFTTKDLLDVLVHTAYSHDFTTNGSSTFQELYPNVKAPSGDLMLHHFSKLRSADKIKETFSSIFDVIFNFAKQNHKSFNTRKVDVAYDVHKVPYYGNKNHPYVTEGKHERGTTHFYQFLTCSIVASGQRFSVDAVPIHKLDSLHHLVDQSLQRVRQKINVDKAYLDRGFDKASIINVIKAHKVKFIMPKIRTETVKAWMRKSEDCKSRVIKNFEIGKGENKGIWR